MRIILSLRPRIQEHITDQTKERLENMTVGDMRKLVSERVAKGKGHLLTHVNVTTTATGMDALTGHTLMFYVTSAVGTIPLVINVSSIVPYGQEEVRIITVVKTILPPGTERNFHEEPWIPSCPKVFAVPGRVVKVEWEGWD